MNQFAALRSVAEGFMADTCVITTSPAVTFNATTGVESNTAGSSVYAGKCRVRPSAFPQLANAGEGVQTQRLYDVWLPYDIVDVDLDHIVTVTASDDPYLVGRDLRVTDVQGGSDGPYRKLQAQDTLSAGEGS